MKKQKNKKHDALASAKMSVEVARSWLRESRETNDGTIDVVSCIEDVCMYLQSVYLMYWRRGQLKEALTTMQEVVDKSLEAAKVIRKFKLKLDSQYWLAFGRAALVSYLIGDDFEPKLLTMCRTTGVPASVLKLHCLRVVDMNLALSISAGKKIRAYDEFVESYYKSTRVRLAKKTYVDYGKLIDAVSKGQRDELPELIANCEENYLKRADDTAYYNFDSNDGACRYNVEHVDYRLAAILKWAYRDYPKERKKLKTIHQWKFD